jgi:hypothetical protein
VSETGYNGAFNATSSDAGVVTVAPAPPGTNTQSDRRQQAQSAQTTFQLSPVSGGAATITVSDSIGDSISIPVSVTGATLTPQQHR